LKVTFSLSHRMLVALSTAQPRKTTFVVAPTGTANGLHRAAFGGTGGWASSA